MLSGKRQAIDSAFIKANASMDSLVEKEILKDGEQYISELQQDEYGNTIQQHENVMRDDRDNDYITQSRKSSTDMHHEWKRTEFKGRPGATSSSMQSDSGDCNVRGTLV